MTDHNENETIDCHWVSWCRLCAKDDARGNVKVYSSEKENDWNSVLLMAIRKYFDVHVSQGCKSQLQNQCKSNL